MPAPLRACVALLLGACSPAGSVDGGSTSGAASSETGSATSSATGSGFLVALDIPAPECDPGRQDCADGEKCTPYALMDGCCVDATRCVPLSGAAGAGEPCTRAADTDDCARGLFCLTAQSGGAGPGTCVQLCDIEDPETCGADRCVQFNDGVLPLCRQACDPLLQDCPMGQACDAVLTEQAFVCLPASGEGAAGEPCETVSACQSGLLCAPASELKDCPEALCCTPLCPIGASDCPAPLVCEQVYDVTQYPEYAGVGYCRIPE